MRTFLSDKNTVFSQISIEKITELYLMTLTCLKSLSTFFEDVTTASSDRCVVEVQLVRQQYTQ